MPRVVADRCEEMIREMPKEESRMKQTNLFMSHLYVKAMKTDYLR